MKSALVFRPYKKDGKRWRTDRRNYRLRDRTADLLFWCQRLAEASEEKVSVLIQHNLVKDMLAISVELPKKTIASHSKDPVSVLWNVCRRVRKETEKMEDAQRKTQERSSRTKNR